MASLGQARNKKRSNRFSTLPFSSPMSDWSQLHQLTTKDVNFPKVPICRPCVPVKSFWYLCSWENQERENEQGNEKSILEQVQQTLLGKMVKISWSLVSQLPPHCQHDFLFLNLNDGPKVPEGHWWLKAKLKRDWWTCQACFLGRNLNFQLSTAIDLWQMTALEKCCWSTQNNHHFHQGRGLVFWRTHLGM